MSKYQVKLLFYGRANLTVGKDALDVGPIIANSSNIRIVPFSVANSEDWAEVGIYELVKLE